MALQLNLILEQIAYEQYERLIEEGKDPVELLHYKFSHIPSDIIDKVIEIDPTKKKSYSQWLLSKWNDEKDTILKNLKNGKIEKLFDYYKNRNDIQIKDLPSVKEGLRSFVSDSDSVLDKSSEPTTYVENLGEDVDSKLANDFDVVYNDGSWVIATPNTYEADCKLGENTRWCTANYYGNGRSYYDRYIDDGGKLFVNFDMTQGETLKGKEYQYTRYQFDFNSHSFMDSDDSPITLDEINITQGAIDYYDSNGYDTEDIENDEVRMERYYEQRSEYSYYLDDGNTLYLNIEFNDDYEMENVNEDTSFYLFDENDDRDPLSWEEIPNPYVYSDAIILNNESLKILEIKDREPNDVCLAVVQIENNYRSWAAYPLEKPITLPNNQGVFGLCQDAYSVVSENGLFSVPNFSTKDCTNAFLNEYCTKVDEEHYTYVETISGKYHSLFIVDSNNIECIIKRDVPANGKMYVPNEQGIIEGTFKRYSIYQDEDADELGNIQLEEELPNGDYIVIANPHNYNKFNIIKKGTKSFLLDFEFEGYNVLGNYGLVVKMSDKLAFISLDRGKVVGKWYDRVYALSKEKGIFGGLVAHFYDIINLAQKRIVTSCTTILTHEIPNDKMIIGGTNDNTYVINVETGEQCFPNLSNFSEKVGGYSYPYVYFCQLDNQDYALFDLKREKILASNLQPKENAPQVKNLSSVSPKLPIRFADNKCNIINIEENKFLLPHNVDDITSIDEMDCFVILKNNGRNFAYNYLHNIYPIAPQGTDLSLSLTNKGIRATLQDGSYIGFDQPNSQGSFNTVVWFDSSNYKFGVVGNDPMPPHVQQAYNQLTNQQQESIRKSFNTLLERINNATILK